MVGILCSIFGLLPLFFFKNLSLGGGRVASGARGEGDGGGGAGGGAGAGGAGGAGGGEG